MTIKPSFTDIIQDASQRSDSLTNILNDSESELIADIVKEMRVAVTKQDFFRFSVETVYRVLRCDRVVVYSLEKASKNEIIAETVNSQFSRTLGSIIEDACFDAEHINKYQRGRIRAIDNIYEAEINPCYLENLEKIEVKANLAVPICDLGGSLYGLLIAHQCSDFRHWNQSEIDLTLQIAIWTAEKLSELKKQQRLEVKIEKFSQWQNSISEFAKEIHQQEKLASVLQLAVDRSRETLKCDRVVIYGLQKRNLGKIVVESRLPILAPILDSVIKDPCFEYRYIDKYQQGRVRATTNIYEAGMSSCYIENLEKIGVRSNLVAPINWDNGKIYGLLVAHQCFRFREWQSEEIEWFKQIGLQTGLSLSKVKLKERANELQSQITAMEVARDTVTISKSKVEQLKQPIRDAAKTLIEMNNFNKLLKRELNIIEETCSPQFKKQTRLIQILIKKLSSSFVELKKSYVLLHNNSNDFQKLLENAAADIYSKQLDDK